MLGVELLLEVHGVHGFQGSTTVTVTVTVEGGAQVVGTTGVHGFVVVVS